MRILISSPAFLPRIGGLENQTALLADGLAGLGQDVVVVTRTALGDAPEPSAPYRVARCPTPAALLGLVHWTDVYIQQHVSLKELWPMLLIRRPWVATHHGWYRQEDGRRSLPDRLKRRMLRHASASVAVSEALARDLENPTTIIPNAYDAARFRELPQVRRDRDLLYVGRLVSNKGVDLLLEALAELAIQGISPNLTVVGEGPERARLEEQVGRLGLSTLVVFVGARSGQALAETMNQHHVLVVPSRYDEPFGMVALEAIACGCVVVGSAGGGLPEAIGPCGVTFPNGDARRLAGVLRELLATPHRLVALRADAANHVSAHAPKQMARAYVELLCEIVNDPHGEVA